jgi:hypothetical protein
LPQNGFDMTGAVPTSYSQYYWVLFFYAWGYADNQPNMQSDHETPNIEGCGIDISWAVDEERKPVKLDFVDFVRVYTGLNQKCGWLLETSTEILGAEDLHTDESISRIKAAIAGIDVVRQEDASSPVYDLQGRPVSHPRRGLYIRNGKKFIIK